VEEISHHLVREFGVGLAGQGSEAKSSSSCPTACQSRRAQCGVGGRIMIAGGCSVITHGTWSDPVKGRGMSYEETKGESVVCAKGKSKMEGLEMVSKGKQVSTPGVLRR